MYLGATGNWTRQWSFVSDDEVGNGGNKVAEEKVLQGNAGTRGDGGEEGDELEGALKGGCVAEDAEVGVARLVGLFRIGCIDVGL